MFCCSYPDLDLHLYPVFLTIIGKVHIEREKTSGIFYHQRERPDYY
jgi:hypothetical protein